MTNRDINDIIEGVTQRGEPVPAGYVFNPRLDPPVFVNEHVAEPDGESSEPEIGGSQMATPAEEDGYIEQES